MLKAIGKPDQNLELLIYKFSSNWKTSSIETENGLRSILVKLSLTFGHAGPSVKPAGYHNLLFQDSPPNPTSYYAITSSFYLL